MASDDSVIKALRIYLKSSDILFNSEDIAPYTKDWRNRYHQNPICIVKPRTTQSIQNILTYCCKNKIMVTPQGGNTSLCGASIPTGSNSIILSMECMNRLKSVNLIDNSITIEAGMSLAIVQAEAKKVNRFFPLSLASEGSCQIGGNIACNAGGVNVLRYGPMRDLVMGLEVVLSDGKIVSQLSPLHKNTSGFDIKHAIIGSEGTLGVITAATLKLFPLEQEIMTLFIACDDINSCIQLLQNLKEKYQNELKSFELIGVNSYQLSQKFYPIELPIEEAPWYVLCELSSMLPTSIWRDGVLDLLSRSSLKDVIEATSDKQRKKLWMLRENIADAQKNKGYSIKHDLALPICQIERFIDECLKDLHKHFQDCEVMLFGHLGDGSLHYNIFLDRDRTKNIYQYEESINEIIYGKVLSLGGTISAEHGVGRLKKEWLKRMKTEEELDLMKQIKISLDSFNIMNPNVIFDI